MQTVVVVQDRLQEGVPSCRCLDPDLHRSDPTKTSIPTHACLNNFSYHRQFGSPVYIHNFVTMFQIAPDQSAI